MKEKTTFVIITLCLLYIVVTSVVDFQALLSEEETEIAELGVDISQIKEYQIYMYDLKTKEISIIQASESELHNPAVSEEYIVYTSYEKGNADIFLYEIQTGKITQITSEPSEQNLARISGELIVWEDARSSVEGLSRDTNSYDVYLYDISTGKEKQIILTRLPDRYPDIDKNIVVSEIYGNALYGNVYYHNLTDRRLTKVTTESVGHEGLRVDNNRIVWHQMHEYDIYMYDITTGEKIKITNTTEKEINPNIQGNYVVYERVLEDNNADIFAYDLETKEEIRITDTSEFYESKPDIYADTIVFVRMFDPQDLEVYAYNIKTKQETRMNTPSDYNYGVNIYGDKIVWSAFNID